MCVCVDVCRADDCLFVFLTVTNADLQAHKLLESPVRYQCKYYVYLGVLGAGFVLKGESVIHSES